jgi:hypothetical protein
MAKLKKTLPKEFIDFCRTHTNNWTADDIEQCKEMLTPCEPNARERGVYNETALHHYIPVGLAEWMIERGADVNAEQTYGTPIFKHARIGKYDVCELLIRHGADLNALDYMEHTPLFAAADGGHADIVRLFLAHGADPAHHEKHFGDNIGNTPLLYMLSRLRPGDRGKAETAQILVEAQGGKANIPAREWKAAQSHVTAKGKDFAFSQAGMEAEYRQTAESEMQQLCALFGVDLPAPIIRHDGISRIEIDSALPFAAQFEKLWEYLVPPSGKCAIVQGEVIRITGRLSDEVYGNGGANWDNDFNKMLLALPSYLRQGQALSETDLNGAEAACSAIRSMKGCGGETEVRALQELAVKWVSLNSDPIPLGTVNYKR